MWKGFDGPLNQLKSLGGNMWLGLCGHHLKTPPPIVSQGSWRLSRGTIDGRLGSFLRWFGRSHAPGDVCQDVSRGHGVDFQLRFFPCQHHGVSDQAGFGKTIGLSTSWIFTHLFHGSTQLLPCDILGIPW